MEPINRKVAEKTQGFQHDPDVFQLPAARQVQRVTRAALERVHDILQLPTSYRQERHIADAESAVLDNLDLRPVSAGIHRPELPGIAEAAHLIHRLEHLQDKTAWCWYRALVHEPARQPRAGEVLAPRHYEDLVATMLDACPGVLDGEGAVTEDGDVVPHERLVGSVVVHAVADAAVELVLAGVIDDPVLRHTAGIIPEDGAVHRLLGSAVQLGDCERIVPVFALPVANNVEGLHIAPELHVRQHAELLRGVLEVLEDLLLPGPGLPVLVGVAAGALHRVLAPPHVERPELRLELRKPVRGGDPAVASDAVIAVEAHDV
mmetsp:Transcript_24914/g.71492  ORF Transcript_24914/g.71492 Transcript_24914/m.71492 type:complete len:319 (+) Transcript_24914:818-1774(+)